MHPIDPRIYATNQPHGLDTVLKGVGLVRQGGNRMTAYNWENNASNAGAVSPTLPWVSANPEGQYLARHPR